MSYRNPFGEWSVPARIDVAVAAIGVLASLLLLGLWFLASQVFIFVIPMATGTACLLYLVIQNRQPTGVWRPVLPRQVAGYLPASVFAGLTALVLWTHAAGDRTVGVHLLTGLVGAVLVAQVLLLPDDQLAPGPMLAQILLAAVVVRFTALSSTPGFVGVDIWTHVPVFVEGMVQSGSNAPLAESKYIMAPFYHDIGAVAALVFGGARSGVYLSLGLLVPLSALFVYAAGTRFVPVRWALLATALYAFSDQFIRWSVHLIPTSLGLVFFLATLYCLTQIFFTGARRIDVGLLLVFGLATVFTHQISTVIVLVVLGIAAAVSVVLVSTGAPTSRSARVRTATALAGVFGVTLATTLLSWANTPWSGGSIFLWRMLEVTRMAATQQAGFLNLAGGGGGGDVAVGASQSLLATAGPFIEVVGFGLLLAVAVVGGLAMLNWNDSPDASMTYLLCAATMFVVVFGMSLFGLRVFLPGRWIAFMYAPLVVVGAVGVHYISRRAPRGVVVATVLVLALGYPTTMVVAEKATLDSPVFDERHARYSYTESELAALRTIGAIRPPTVEPVVHTDHPYQTIYERVGGYNTEIVEVGEDGEVSPGSVVYREYQSTGVARLHTREVPPRDIHGHVAESTVCPGDRNRIYANDQVTLCTPSTVTGGGL